MSETRFPHKCPSCGSTLIVVKLQCKSCNTSITGQFDPCPICKLDEEFRTLFDLFLSTRGNLKAMERELKISYPTVRQKVEELFSNLTKPEPELTDPMEIIRRVREGTLSVEKAEQLLRLCTGKT